MKIGVIGAGAWGTALAQVAAAGGEETWIWAREPEVVASINDRHENEMFLKGISLSPAILASGDLGALAGCDAFLVVTPAQHLRSVTGQLPAGGKPLILCAKGIEDSTGMLMHEVATMVQPASPIAVLSGPTFAHEVAAGLPTAVTLAAEDRSLGERLAARIARPFFRPYISTDLAGAEVGGAVKNVLAIACGVVEGSNLGQNARAALIARGFAEMARFGLAHGARLETLTGMAGLGDLVLPCTSTSSRNFSLGKAIAEGRSAKELMSDRRTVAEGAFTAPVLRRIADEQGIDMPIVTAVDDLLAERRSLPEVLEALRTRPPRRTELH